MTANGWIQIIVFLGLILAVTKPLGIFMARVFSRERTFLDPVMRPVERLLYRMTGVDEDHEMRWTEYALTMLLPLRRNSEPCSKVCCLTRMSCRSSPMRWRWPGSWRRRTVSSV